MSSLCPFCRIDIAGIKEWDLEKGTAAHSSILAWRIPWSEQPGGLYSPWGRKEPDTAERQTLSVLSRVAPGQVFSALLTFLGLKPRRQHLY